jgi:hypothetical protein
MEDITRVIKPAGCNSLEFDLLELPPKERAAILHLRQKIPRLPEREKIVFCVLILLYPYDPDVIQWVHLCAAAGLKPDFSSAVLEAIELSKGSKFMLAIEILQGEKRDNELPGGYYFCPQCDRKTSHHYVDGFGLKCSDCEEC